MLSHFILPCAFHREIISFWDMCSLFVLFLPDPNLWPCLSQQAPQSLCNLNASLQRPLPLHATDFVTMGSCFQHCIWTKRQASTCDLSSPPPIWFPPCSQQFAWHFHHPKTPRRPDGVAPPARKLSRKSDSVLMTMKWQWKQQLKQCCNNSPTAWWGRISNLAWCLRTVELTIVRRWCHLLLSSWCSPHSQGLGNVAANLHTSKKDMISHVLASQNVS